MADTLRRTEFLQRLIKGERDSKYTVNPLKALPYSIVAELLFADKPKYNVIPDNHVITITPALRDSLMLVLGSESFSEDYRQGFKEVLLILGILKKYLREETTHEYVVTFNTMDEVDVSLLIKIKVSVNRPNNPDDDEIIHDYLKLNYGERVDYETLKWSTLDSTVIISETYEVEV
jgi:hypothetical protein